MLNPLRLPIVLALVFILMLVYVHANHRRRAELNEATVPIRDHLQLRQPPGQRGTSNYAGDAAINTSPSSAAIASSRPGALFPSESIRSLPLPKIDDSLRDSEPAAAPRATLIGPIIADAVSILPDQLAPTETFPAAGPPPDPDIAQRRYELSDDVTPGVVMHRIVDGDTLPRLAERYLGDASRYPEIMDRNRDILLQPDLLPLGVRLRIPSP